MWELKICLDGESDLVEGTFDSLREGEEWLQERYPGFFRKGIWMGEAIDWKQYGTDYYWASFTRTPKPERVPPAPWYNGGHLLAPSGTMNLPHGYLGRWCCACGTILKRTPSSSEAFEEHLADLRSGGA